ncbi:MAG: hypothetical protein WA400_16355 [Silvibacterium sp.]
MILLGLMRVATDIYWSLPKWLTNTLFHSRAGDISTLDILFVLVAVAMYYIERRCIFKQPEDADQTFSETSNS